MIKKILVSILLVTMFLAPKCNAMKKNEKNDSFRASIKKKVSFVFLNKKEKIDEKTIENELKEPLLKKEFIEEINIYDEKMQDNLKKNYVAKQEYEKLENRINGLEMSIQEELKKYIKHTEKNILTVEDIGSFNFAKKDELDNDLKNYPKIQELQKVLEVVLDKYHRNNLNELCKLESIKKLEETKKNN